jgi:hypothetical protein
MLREPRGSQGSEGVASDRLRAPGRGAPSGGRWVGGGRDVAPAAGG